MAKAIRKNTLIVFHDNEPDTQAEWQNEVSEPVVNGPQKFNVELSPFQRVKHGARECFLAAEAYPVRTHVN